jgi:hypothetical protein
LDVLTVATLNLEDGAAVDLLPELAAQAGQIGLLLFQEGKNWHRDGHRTRYRAEGLLAEAGLDRSVMTGDKDRGPLHTLIFWNSRMLRLRAHYDPAWDEWVPLSRRGVAEFETPSGLVLYAKSVHWAHWGGDARLDEAGRTTWLADPRRASVVGGDCNSLWPDCPGQHQEFEPDWAQLPEYKRGHKTMDPGAGPGEADVSDRRALTKLARAGFRSAGCIAGDMTPTVASREDNGQGPRIDHLALSRALAACVIDGSYAVHRSEVGSRASNHYMVSVGLDLDQGGLMPEAGGLPGPVQGPVAARQERRMP